MKELESLINEVEDMLHSEEIWLKEHPTHSYSLGRRSALRDILPQLKTIEEILELWD
jgi:hypothetical protein